jgi:hypothetical protein
MLSSS